MCLPAFCNDILKISTFVNITLEIVLQATSSDDENPYDKNIHNVFIILHKLLVSVWYCVETFIFNNFFCEQSLRFVSFSSRFISSDCFPFWKDLEAFFVCFGKVHSG